MEHSVHKAFTHHHGTFSADKTYQKPSLNSVKYSTICKTKALRTGSVSLVLIRSITSCKSCSKGTKGGDGEAPNEPLPALNVLQPLLLNENDFVPVAFVG